MYYSIIAYSQDKLYAFVLNVHVKYVTIKYVST